MPLKCHPEQREEPLPAPSLSQGFNPSAAGKTTSLRRITLFMSEVQHKTSGIQIFLLGLLLLLFYRPSAKPIGYADPAAPPLGTYHCWTGGFNHLPAGTLTLAPNGHYESYRPRGGGSYSFFPSNSTVEFLDGDYHYWEYRGIYQRTHTPSAPNSGNQSSITQPEPSGERIVLMPIGNKSPIGSERPGEYQYCYRDAAVASR